MFTAPSRILRQVQYTLTEREIMGFTMHWLLSISALAYLSDMNHLQVG